MFHVVNSLSLDQILYTFVLWILWLQCDELVEHGASIGETPAAVVKKCKYTIAMLSDPSAALSVSTSQFSIYYFILLSLLAGMPYFGDFLGSVWPRWCSRANFWWKRLHRHVNSRCWYFFKDQWGLNCMLILVLPPSAFSFPLTLLGWAHSFAIYW